VECSRNRKCWLTQELPIAGINRNRDSARFSSSSKSLSPISMRHS
jgi:hypothetical protein